MDRVLNPDPVTRNEGTASEPKWTIGSDGQKFVTTKTPEFGHANLTPPGELEIKERDLIASAPNQSS